MPAGPHEFRFWTATDTTLGIGAIVRVDDGSGRTVYAVVIDGRSYSDLATPLHDVVAAEGDPAATGAPTRRTEIRLWTAAVLRQQPEEPLQPVPIAGVKLATREDVETALPGNAHVLLDMLWGEARRGHHAGVLDLLDPAPDEVRLHRLLIDLLDGPGGLIVRGLGDLGIDG